ncbi:MAG TPA: ROK family transcriptional regulator [Ktedonobacteraceae bacterium]
MTTAGEGAERESLPGTPRLLRAINERMLWDHLRNNSPMSRAQLARATGLSKPTVSNALGNLERVGLVRPTGAKSAEHGGRHGILYEADPTAGYVLGIDIGRSWVRVALADLMGTIVMRRDGRNQARTAVSLVNMTSELAKKTVAEAGLNWSQVVHTVVGTPGVFDRPSERVILAPNLPGLEQRGIMELLQSALGPGLSVDNDANLAALGERVFGGGKEVDTFVFLTIGTGIGMGIITNGTLYRGAHGAGGEVAYLPLGMATIPTIESSAGQRGMLEESVAAKGIMQQAHEMGMQPPLSAKHIFDAAREGDSRALAVVEHETQLLAQAIAAVAAVLDPEIVILGGGIGQNFDLLGRRIEHHLSTITRICPRIVPSQLGQDVVLLGAIATGLEIANDLVFQQRAGDESANSIL